MSDDQIQYGQDRDDENQHEDVRMEEDQDTDVQYDGDDDPCMPERGRTPMAFVGKGTRPSGEEVMAFLCWQWNVTAAKEIAADKDPNSFLDVQDCRGELAGSPHLVDRERALSEDFDASQPLITVVVRMEGHEIGLVLDGWNRMYRAYRDGVDGLPAYQLSPEEERSVRLNGNWEFLDQ